MTGKEEYMQKVNAYFLSVLDNKNGSVIGAVMLPNTKHLEGTFNVDKFKRSIYELLSIHQKFIDVCHLYVDSSNRIGKFLPNRLVKKGAEPSLFAFNRADHRYKLSQLPVAPNETQMRYLKSKVLFHAWGAIDNGLLVGMVVYPAFENCEPNDPSFMKYKSDARVLLKKIGYPIAGDLVLDENGVVRFYRVVRNHKTQYRNMPFWTQEIGLTKSLRNNIK